MSQFGFFTNRKNSDEAEKPFWISYADLMTALMVLFLVIMVTSLSLITTKVEEAQLEIETNSPDKVPLEIRAKEISSICDELSVKVSKVSSVANVDCRLNRINFGEVGRFKTDEYRLSKDGERVLAEVVPVILDAANSNAGRKWLKQVVIEGFTDMDGSYLYNLNLSLRRSEWVMCTLLRNDSQSTLPLTTEQRRQIKKLFLAGGVSFNNIRESKDASRRVELRLQFYGLDNNPSMNSEFENKFEDSPNEKCYI